MKKIWLVAAQEYRRHVFTRRFLFGLLSIPLVVALFIGIFLLVFSLESNTTPIGYVDASGLLTNPVPAPAPEWPDKPVPTVSYPTEAQARAALDAGQIQAFYVLPADYLTTGALKAFHIQPVKDASRRAFYSFLAANLLKNTDPAIATRLVEGVNMTVQSVDGKRSIGEDNWFSFITPMVMGIGFMIAMFTSGGYLMQAVTEEKENRTMEVVVTSVTPNQLMAGKVVGDTAVGLTQILFWILFIITPVLIFQGSVKFLQGIQLSGQTVLVLIFVMLPSFVLVSGLMAMIGATVSESREGQQMTGLVAMPVWIPYALFVVFMNTPNSPLAMAMSWIPMTAPMTMLVRDGLTVLPWWDIAASSAIQILSAGLVIWLAGKAFRAGMLRYGKRLSLREIFAKS